MAVADVERLKSLIRDVPDWPEPGVVFKDIMPLLGNAAALQETIDVLGDWAAERSTPSSTARTRSSCRLTRSATARGW